MPEQSLAPADPGPPPTDGPMYERTVVSADDIDRVVQRIAHELLERNRSAADLVDLEAIDREGEGSYELLWRTEHSEAWLNTWWEARDTGFHDHGGSCVGVHLLEGRARVEGLVVGGGRRVTEYATGESFSEPTTGIHRMEHDAGAVTIHVYSPPLGSIGHYEVVDGDVLEIRFNV